MKLPIPSLAAAAILLMPLALPAPAHADEAAVRQRLGERLPNVKIDQLSPTPYPGLYEIYSSGVLLYTDEEVRYLIQGALIDAKTRQNLSNERLRELTAIDFDQLPLEHSIKIVKGDGKRRLAIFEDPDCPYCRQLENELDKVDNVTLHIFLYPIEPLHRGATEKSRKIWCADDPAKAWEDAVRRGVIADNPGDCATPIEQLAELGRRLRIAGTPTLFFGDSKRVAGAIPAAQIEKLLDNPAPAPSPSAEKPAEK
ncbi:DsbC family protein [Thauera aromatica]|uniref:DsbC family protein n=1 Tax=Thauera aromatica TaxID=59405 RepID=UPI001FFDC2CA|nr:DsbC family protein [Thauera aromatica]MCK2094404.1 DsbC family protein [Thauera aromatica]